MQSFISKDIDVNFIPSDPIEVSDFDFLDQILLDFLDKFPNLLSLVFFSPLGVFDACTLVTPVKF